MVTVRKIVSIGLFGLLLYHMLVHVIVCIGAWWQAEHDLSERLLVYRSVDSLVDFDIPLLHGDSTSLRKLTDDGFTYRDHYYEVVSLELRGDTLHIAGLETKNQSLWKNDLLTFLNKHLSGTTDSQQKNNQFLKFLLKEYPPGSRTIFSFLSPPRREAIRLPDLLACTTSRTLPVPSPPPQA